MVKNLPSNTGDAGSIPGLGRSPGGGNGNPLQYSCLENPMGRGAWQATVCGISKSRTQLTMCAKTCVQRPQRDERGRPSRPQRFCGLKLSAKQEISTRTPTPPPSSLWPNCHPSGPPAAQTTGKWNQGPQPSHADPSRVEREPPREAASRLATSSQVHEVLRRSSTQMGPPHPGGSLAIPSEMGFVEDFYSRGSLVETVDTEPSL